MKGDFSFEMENAKKEMLLKTGMPLKEQRCKEERKTRCQLSLVTL